MIKPENFGIHKELDELKKMVKYALEKREPIFIDGDEVHLSNNVVGVNKGEKIYDLGFKHGLEERKRQLRELIGCCEEQQ